MVAATNAREECCCWIGKIQRRIQAVKQEAGWYNRKLIRHHVIQ